MSADFGHLERDIAMLNESACDWLHVDVMDGVFVPNISFGQPIVKAIKRYAAKPLDVHLMITDPDRYIRDFADAGADIITVHSEACIHLDRTLKLIKDCGCRSGVALNPATPLVMIENVLDICDLVLLMSVNPGFGGQSFIENTYNKVSAFRQLREQRKSSCLISVDGGVNLSNAPLLFNAGCDVLVAGNAVFKSDSPQLTIQKLKQ